MTAVVHADFDDPQLLTLLCGLGNEGLDQLGFGAIGFDADGVIRRYNAWESRAAGLSVERTVGQPLFTVVAPCMNNQLVAQRFEAAARAAEALDATVPYVLTLRMRPTKVRLRLLAPAGEGLRYVLIHRL